MFVTFLLRDVWYELLSAVGKNEEICHLWPLLWAFNVSEALQKAVEQKDVE